MPRDYKLQLDDITEAIGRIKEYTANMSEESFALDHKTQDAVIRNLEIIGEAARNLPDQIKDSTSENETVHRTVSLFPSRRGSIKSTSRLDAKGFSFV